MKNCLGCGRSEFVRYFVFISTLKTIFYCSLTVKLMLYLHKLKNVNNLQNVKEVN